MELWATHSPTHPVSMKLKPHQRKWTVFLGISSLAKITIQQKQNYQKGQFNKNRTIRNGHYLLVIPSPLLHFGTRKALKSTACLNKTQKCLNESDHLWMLEVVKGQRTSVFQYFLGGLRTPPPSLQKKKRKILCCSNINL